MWIFLAILTAVGTAVRDAASKHATRALDPIVVGCGISAVPAVLLSGWVVGRATLEQGFIAALTPGPGFLPALAISGGINAVTTPLIVWALKRSDLSLMAPLTSLTPLFMIPVALVVLGEAPSVAGGVGVAVIVVGAYLLNVSDRDAGPMAPLAALARDPGARAMLLVAFLYSISGTYDKVGTQASSPLAWAAAVQGVVALILAPLAIRRWRKRRVARRDTGQGNGQAAPVSRDPADGAASAALGWLPGPGTAVLVAGVVTAIAAAAQMTAITLTLVAYVIAVKRTSTLFSVLLGHSLFREEGIGERLLGAAVMVAGFVLVTLG